MAGSVRLMAHQREAIDRLHTGSILCGGVGTGKSITALGYFFLMVCHGFLWSDGRVGPMKTPTDLYIITTARKRDTKEWEVECDRYDLLRMPEGKRIVIDSWNNLHKYEDTDGAFFIFDEQRVVGSGAWSKSFLKVTKRNDWILLSATPGDSWADYIPVFLANGFYKSRRAFLKRHAVYSPYVTKFPKIERWIDVGYLETLRRRITVTMHYEKQTTPHWETLSIDYDHDLYKKVAQDRWDYVLDEPIQDISRACSLMRRVSSGRTTEIPIGGSCFEVSERALKVFWLGIKKHPRLIVFYNFDYELEALKACFEKMRGVVTNVDYAVAEWNGHVHEPLPTMDNWFYLVQYSAGCEGWNCVETDAMIFYSRSYSYKTMTQAAGRIDRLNTPYSDLYYYVLTSDSPIDKAIGRALRGKRSFNEKNWIKWE